MEVLQCEEDYCVDILKSMKQCRPIVRDPMCDCHNTTRCDTDWSVSVIGFERVFVKMVGRVGIVVHVVDIDDSIFVTQMNVMAGVLDSYYHRGSSVQLSHETFNQLLAAVDMRHANWELIANHIYNLFQSVCEQAVERTTY